MNFVVCRRFLARSSQPLKRPLSTSVSSSSGGEGTTSSPGVYVDVFGRRLRKYEGANRLPFYYDEDTFDSYEQLMISKERPQYATSWEDARFPGWYQFMDSTGKRPYYVDYANPISQVTWAPPGDPEQDIFKAELEEMQRPFKSIPSDVEGISLLRRLGATGLDVGVSLGVGLLFGSLVLLDMGKIMEAGQGFGFMTLVSYVARDAMNYKERGTRSLGKKWMKIEIVTREGTLPSRWHTFARQATIPLYLFGPQFFFPEFVVFPIFELGLVLFTTRAYRVGDLIGRTRVVAEQADREERFQEKCKREDEDDAKD